MGIKIIAAKTAEELDSVFRLRHRVFVKEFHRFPRREQDTRLVDVFDAVPGATVLAAMDGDYAVGTLRVNEDTKIGLPADEYVDFSDTRERLKAKGAKTMMGCSMLVVDPEWRFGRRTVFDLFGGASEVMRLNGATHILATVSAETISLYSRMGFVSAGKAEWHRPIGDYLVPIWAPYETAAHWHLSVKRRGALTKR